MESYVFTLKKRILLAIIRIRFLNCKKGTGKMIGNVHARPAWESLILLCVGMLSAAAAHAAAPWSDTPVTCHWIGAVRAGSSTYGAYASWTNAENWAEGIVPGMYIKDGVTNGCPGCSAVFDRACDYQAADFITGPNDTPLISISNIVVSSAAVPQIFIGRSASPYFMFERNGGLSVGGDVVTAPTVSSYWFLRGGVNTTTTLKFENNSATPLVMNNFKGPDTAFTASAGTMVLAMRGSGDIRADGNYTRSRYTLRISLGMSGGKFIQNKDATVDYIRTEAGVGLQHLEIPSGKTLTIPEAAMPLIAESDLLVDGGGTCHFSAAADKAAVIGVASGKTLTLDCGITRTAGGRFQIGHGSYSGGTVVLAPGRSFGNAQVDFYSGTLQLPSNETFTSAITIPSSRRGTIAGGTLGEAKLAGGVSGTTRPLTLKGKLAIASSVTASTTAADDAEISFRKVDSDATAFTISSLTLDGDKTIPVEDGVTATISAIDNNGYKLDIRPSGTGKVLFPGLSVGHAPEWLTLNGAPARISDDGELLSPSGMCVIFR